ncbi:MAG: histidine kinase [Bacteroidales bacterium]
MTDPLHLVPHNTESLHFTRLSDLMRRVMSNAFESATTLGEEIDFVKSYLQIETNRFDNKFTWSVRLDEEVDMAVVIPKMLIQIFVENAIKHGIFHLDAGGEIEIGIHRTGPGILILVTDNGVGFEKAFELEGRKGKGLEILNNYLQLFNKHHEVTISCKILNRASGGRTRVLIDVL